MSCPYNVPSIPCPVGVDPCVYPFSQYPGQKQGFTPAISRKANPFHPAINHWAILGNPYGIEAASRRDSTIIDRCFNVGRSYITPSSTRTTATEYHYEEKSESLDHCNACEVGRCLVRKDTTGMSKERRAGESIPTEWRGMPSTSSALILILIKWL